jgi:prepilin-type N-terminal cleavage/methylation domain-containing protein
MSKLTISNKQQANFQLSRAFTLIEILVAMTILLLLISAASVYWRNAVVKRRDTQRKADLRAIQFAIETYYQDNGFVPRHNDPTYRTNCSDEESWINPLVSPGLAEHLVPKYIDKLPVDPLNQNNGNDSENTFLYCYMPYLGGNYLLFTRLENLKDPDINRITGIVWDLPGMFFYNYRVHSSED